MQKTPINTAAVQPAARAPKLEIKEVPYPTPSDDKLVIRNAAVAISPIDWLLQSRGDMVFPWLKFPFILGIDVAGEVVSVGKNITRFKVGDRVFGGARGVEKPVNDSAEGGYQQYVVMQPGMLAPIPDSIKYEEAVVTPLALATIGCTLFSKEFLGMQLPVEPARRSLGKTVIIWGGSTSLGLCGIQLAVSAGYDVVTTCSPKNFELVRSLGAAQTFDYNSPTVVKDMIAALKGKTVMGAAAMGDNSPQMCMDVLARCSNDSSKHVIVVSLPQPPPGSSPTMGMVSLLTWLVTYKISGFFKGVKSSLMFSHQHETIEYLFNNYLPEAMESGSYRPLPEPYIVGHGLDKIQEAFEKGRKKDLSAKKLVVTL